MTDLIRNRYKLVEKIGNGNFGVVYKAFDIKCDVDVAIKFDRSNIGFLRHEATVLNYLSSNKCRNIPLIHWYGIYSSIPCVVIPFYQYSLLQHVTLNKINELELEILFNKMLNILESIHIHMVIHRDIKPDNFMFNNKGDLILIDFGLSTFDLNTNKDSCNFTGNIIYASPNIHNLKAAKAIDDIISASYIYIFLGSGCNLHWMNMDDTTDINNSKMIKIYNAKMLSNLEIQLSNNIINKTKIMCLLEKLYRDKKCYTLC
jgi:serine/threonine protein kinase